jgi:hypothetical protein
MGGLSKKVTCAEQNQDQYASEVNPTERSGKILWSERRPKQAMHDHGKAENQQGI